MIPIAHIVLGLQVGGLERVVVNLVQGFRDTPFRPEVICLESGGPFADELRRAGFTVTVLGKRPGMDWQCIRRLARLLREHDIQIVHTHNPVPHFHGVLAALLARVPVRVHTKHGRNYPGIRKRVLLYRALSWVTDAIVPVSDNARDVALQIEKVNPRKVHRIWNGVDLARYAPGARCQVSGFGCQAEEATPGDPSLKVPVIGTVARLSPEKDQATMLQAFRLLLEEWSRVPQASEGGNRAAPSPLTPETRHLKPPKLVFVGDGSCAAALRDHAAKLGIADHVEFLGERADIPEQLNRFDLFTLSSITEGISMTLLEAMACGVPIVATDVGGNREIVNPPECGLIVPPRDPRALADAYLQLLRDPATRARMATAGRQRVGDQFSLEAMVRQYRELYETLLANKGPQTADRRPQT